MTTRRGDTQAKVLAVSERDLLVGKSSDDKPLKATDNTALPDGSVYLERNTAKNTVTEYIRVDGEWVFDKTYSVDKPIEELLAEMVTLQGQTVEALEQILSEIAD
mgnify:FL=1